MSGESMSRNDRVDAKLEIIDSLKQEVQRYRDEADAYEGLLAALRLLLREVCDAAEGAGCMFPDELNARVGKKLHASILEEMKAKAHE